MGFAELRLGVNLVSYKSPLDFTQKFGFSFGEGIVIVLYFDANRCIFIKRAKYGKL